MASQTRPLASLTISFGLVAIPVKLYSATVASERLSFHLLRKSDGSRLKEQYVAVNDGKIVDRSEMVKGYEITKGKHVVFAPEELKALEESTSSALQIAQFVPLDSIDPVYFLASYYLLPDKSGTKPYALLSMALSQEGRCAVGKWTWRGREHVILIRPVSNGLALHELHFKAEVRSLKDFGYEPSRVSEQEVKLARQLIDQMSAKAFDPDEFVDERRARVAAEIRRKVQGKQMTLDEVPAAQPRSNVIDLMGALRASLKTKDGRASPRKSKSRKVARAA